MDRLTDCQAHVERLEADLAGLHSQVEEDASSHSAVDLQTRFFSRKFQLLSLTGELRKLQRLYTEIENVRTSSHIPSDLWLAQACIALKIHRFRDASGILAADPRRTECPQGRLIQADLYVQMGAYAAAREQIVRALEQDVTWDALTRMAYLEGLLGDVDEADRLYLSAQDELTAKEMHAFAWVEVQRGVLDFQRGRYAEADAHYRRASKAYSGYWLVEERIAEVNGARGAFDEAIGTYAGLYRWQARPEWAHAMGDLCSLRGDIGSAHTWKLAARDGYLDSIEEGGVHSFHSLADLCCEMPGETEEAVRWARMDEALRSNFQTQGNLAWALYRDERPAEAERWAEKAIESGAVCGRLYLQAACIFAAAGRAQASQRYFRLARTFNALPVKAFLAVRPSGMEIRVVPALRGCISLQQQNP